MRHESCPRGTNTAKKLKAKRTNMMQLFSVNTLFPTVSKWQPLGLGTSKIIISLSVTLFSKVYAAKTGGISFWSTAHSPLKTWGSTSWSPGSARSRCWPAVSPASYWSIAGDGDTGPYTSRSYKFGLGLPLSYSCTRPFCGAGNASSAIRILQFRTLPNSLFDSTVNKR